MLGLSGAVDASGALPTSSMEPSQSLSRPSQEPPGEGPTAADADDVAHAVARRDAGLTMAAAAEDAVPRIRHHDPRPACRVPLLTMLLSITPSQSSSKLLQRLHARPDRAEAAEHTGVALQHPGQCRDKARC